MEVGQICKKTSGREKGRYCIVVKIEGNFAEITGIKKYKMCRRRKCNVKHLKPIKFRIKIDSDKQVDIEKKLSESGFISKFGLIKDRNLKKKKPIEKPKLPKKKKPKKVKKQEIKKPNKNKI
jgi:large subunit ribosomal protein L14e